MHTTFICAGELFAVEQRPYCDPLKLLPLVTEFTLNKTHCPVNERQQLQLIVCGLGFGKGVYRMKRHKQVHSLTPKCDDCGLVFIFARKIWRVSLGVSDEGGASKFTLTQQSEFVDLRFFCQFFRFVRTSYGLVFFFR